MKSNNFEIGLIGGVEKREIKIVNYDPEWNSIFQVHFAKISGALPGSALRIEHIGSTAVPELAAKPIVDILVEVANASDESTYLDQLENVGYVLRVREPDWNEHRMFRTPEKDVHIHIYSQGCFEVKRVLAFRDHLRKNPIDRLKYEELKRNLANNDWTDMNAYADAKTELIEEILTKANIK